MSTRYFGAICKRIALFSKGADLFASQRGLICCYLELDRPAEGLAIYARCEETLARELCITPSTETRALRQSLTTTDPSPGS